MTPDQFAEKIKAKYPEYRDMDNLELTNKILNKYPQYESRVNLPQTQQTSNRVLGKTQDVLTTVFGGEKIGEAIGTQIAKMGATEEEKQFISPGPTTEQVAGDVLRTSALFTPVGKIAGFIGKGATALGLGTKTAQVVGNVTGGATAGALADVGLTMAEGEKPSLGMGTLIGAGIPLATPVAVALAKATSNVARRAVFEMSGKFSGTSEETLEQAYQAALKGGKDLDQLTEALRSRANPEKLVSDLNDSLTFVKTEQQKLFRDTLKELSSQQVTSNPAKESFEQTLNKFKVEVTEKGLDFSKSELRTVPAAQSKIVQAWNEITAMPDVISIDDLDTTRQAVKAIKLIASDDASANKANTIIEDAVRSVRKAGEQVEGYGKMLDNFGETAEFLDELERGLSSGNRSTVDQTYRRIISSLRTNNEQRKALIEELDEATGGAILSQIAGQQLSEFLPRGIFGRFFAPFLAGGAITGGVSTPLISGLLFASPRVTGEFARGLGLTAAKTDVFIKTIDTMRDLLVKTGAITASEVEQASDSSDN